MPVINLDYTDLKYLSGLSNNDIENSIPMIGSEIEKISEDSISVEFFPNRPDLYSVEGVARALKTFCGICNEIKEYKIFDSGCYIINVNESVSSINHNIVGVVIKNILLSNKIINTLDNLIEDLHWSIGRNKKKITIKIHNSKNISFPLEYKFTYLNLKQNMNGFDLQNKKYIFLMDNNNNLISISGIGKNNINNIDKNTTDLFVEITGNSIEEAKYALNILTAALIDRGGDAYSTLICYNGKSSVYPNMKLIENNIEYKYIENILGKSLSNYEIIKSLNKMGHKVRIIESNDKKMVNVKTHPFRVDIFNKRDIVEDIAIGYGYNNFDYNNDSFYYSGRETKYNYLRKKLFSILLSLGFTQVMPFTLTSEKIQFDMMNKNEDRSVTKIINPMSEDQSIVRVSILPCLLDILSINKHNELPQKIFEIGEVIIDSNKQYILSFVEINSMVNFTSLLEVNNLLFNEMNINYELLESEEASFINGRRADIYHNNNKVGILGEFDPSIISNFELEYPVLGFEINLSKILKI